LLNIIVNFRIQSKTVHKIVGQSTHTAAKKKVKGRHLYTATMRSGVLTGNDKPRRGI